MAVLPAGPLAGSVPKTPGGRPGPAGVAPEPSMIVGPLNGARAVPGASRVGAARATAGGGAVQAVGAGAQLLGREHAQPVSEILLLLVQLVVEQGDLVAQFFIGAGRLRQALGQALDLVLQGLDPVFVGLDLVGELFGLTVLAVFMGLACRFFFVTFA